MKFEIECAMQFGTFPFFPAKTFKKQMSFEDSTFDPDIWGCSNGENK